MYLQSGEGSSMKTAILVAMMLAVLAVIGPTDGFAWESTDIDTAEVLYDNGQVKEQYQQVLWSGNERTYRQGFYRAWHENGQLAVDGQFARDRKVETWLTWDSTGARTEEIFYQDGVMDGPDVRWNPDGSLLAALNYRDGGLHGLCSWYRGDVGINDWWNNPPLVVVAQKYFVHGVEMIALKDSTGSATLRGRDGPYYNDNLCVWIDFDDPRYGDETGGEFRVGSMENGRKQGVWVTWSEDGDMRGVDIFEAGRRVKHLEY